ncbi:hypothetical protein Trydic_g505 [Trypoxylus dichotomus]
MLVQFCVVLFILDCAYGNNLIITNFTQCDKPMQDVQMTCKMKNGEQYCSGVYKSPVENGENFRAELTVDVLRGKTWRNFLRKKEEKGLCYLMETLMREPFYQILENVDLPKKCPIPKGTAELLRSIKFRIDGIEMLSVLPKTKIRLKIKSYEKSSGKLGVCVTLVVEIRN